MSEVLSEVIEQVYKNKRMLVGIKCDICERLIPAIKDPVTGRYSNLYYTTTTGHYEWFNDSCDSIENHDICPECIDKFVGDYLKSTKYNSAYIEVKRHIVYPKVHWD